MKLFSLPTPPNPESRPKRRGAPATQDPKAPTADTKATDTAAGFRSRFTGVRVPKRPTTKGDGGGSS